MIYLDDECEEVLKLIINELDRSNTNQYMLDDNICSMMITQHLIKSGYLSSQKGPTMVLSGNYFAAVNLTYEGKKYFESKYINKYGEIYMEKIKFIDEFINEGKEMLKINDFSNAKQYLERFIRIFQNEIPRISEGLDAWYYSGEKGTKWEDDIQMVIEKLKNRKADIAIEAEKIKVEKMKVQVNPVFNNSNNNSNENTQNISINFSSVIKTINKCEGLTSDQKIEITNMLSELEDYKKEKPKLWEKVKNVLSWLADKTVDVGIAILPYIAGLM